MNRTPSHRLVIVEDHDLLRRSMVRALVTVPHLECRAAATVDEGLALIASWRPSLCWTDIDLKDWSRDGFDVALAARLAGARVLVMSGTVDQERRQRAAKLGAEVTAKPFDIYGRAMAMLGSSRQAVGQ